MRRGIVSIVKGGIRMRRISRGCAWPVLLEATWPVAPWPFGRSSQLAHRNWANRRPGDLGDVLHSNAVVDDGPVVAVEIEVVDDRRLVVNPPFFPRRDAMTARMQVAEISRRHERVAIRG